MGERVLRIKQEGLIHDTVSGEAIVLNIETGTYYSLAGSAAEIWNLIGAKLSLAQISALIEHHYSAALTAREDVEAFIATLLAEGLVFEDGDASGAPPEAFVGGSDWRKPELAVFDDLQDLLTIDPIHDVDESGWPNAKRP
jgi:hypothetical protein